jgi:thiamine-monophosphate kinase
MAGEYDFLAWIRNKQRPTALVQVPAGDDLAVLKWPADDLLLVGVDQVLDGVHFDSSIHPPRAIGKKAMNRNLSDCAAMGCLPVAALVCLALPADAGGDYAKQLYHGIRAAASRFECDIVGGDTGSWNGKLALSVTILGRADGFKPIIRAGARVGDGIYVTGPLGGSIIGRHMNFAPRVREGRELAKSGVVTSMIDLSDGLSRDLPRITDNAVIEEAAIPIHDDARISRPDARTPFEHALHDGEDYELLFTACAPPPLGVRIGTITADAGIQLLRQDGNLESLPAQGWEHRL